MKTIKYFALAAMVCFLLAGSAFGGPIVQTFTLNPTTTDILGTTGTGTFNFFGSAGAPAGSTLTSVTLEMFVNDAIQSLTVTNTSTGSADIRYRDTMDITTVGSAPDVALLNLGTLAMFDSGTLTYTSGQTRTFAPPIIAKSGDTGMVNGTTAAYTGTGTFTLGFQTLTNETFNGGGGNVNSALTTKANGTVTVIYNYTTQTTGTPEPATMAMLGSALIGLGLIGRKRFAR